MQCKPIKSIPPRNKKKNGRASCWLAQSYGLTGGWWPFQIRHGVGDWPFHWPGWSIRLSRSGLHGRSLVSYGNIDYHLGRSRSGGCQPQAVICTLVPLQSRECPPHLAHGPINRRRRSSGDVARELVDRFPTRQDKAYITVLRTNILVVLVTSIWRGCHSVAGIRAKTRTWISYAMQPYLSSLFFSFSLFFLLMAHVLPSLALPILAARFADGPVPVRICRCFGADRQGSSHMEAMRRNRRAMLLWVIPLLWFPFSFSRHIYFNSFFLIFFSSLLSGLWKKVCTPE